MSEGKTSNQHVFNFVRALFGLVGNNIFALAMIGFVVVNLACTYRQFNQLRSGVVCSIPRK